MNEDRAKPWRRFTGLIDVAARFKKNQRWAKDLVLWLPDWVTPNRVTAFRSLALGPVIVLAICWGWYWSALFTFALSKSLDALDGWIAEFKPKLKTTYGPYWDPLADKAVICATYLTLLSTGLVPYWFRWVIWPIVGLAGLNTAVRTWKIFWDWLQQALKIKPKTEKKVVVGDPSTGPIQPTELAASNFGKFKLLNEAAAGLWVLLGLALGSTFMVYSTFAFMLTALLFALKSAKDQLLK